MPRPKLSNTVLKLEVRITPPDQKEITNWKYENEFTKLLIATEGTPNGTPRLHYHIYLETDKSESWVRTWIKCVLIGHFNPDEKINGNAMYFTRKPHERTIPYVIKHGDILVRIGFAQQLIDEYFKQSEEYIKTKQSDRKRKQRSRIDEMEEVFTDIQNDTSIRTPSAIITRALYLCHEKGYKFPSKITMEQYVLKIMYKYDESIVRYFYEKPFERY